jgi:hypothetical protein
MPLESRTSSETFGSFDVVAIIAAYNEEDIIGQVVRALIAEGVSVHLNQQQFDSRMV